MAQSRMGTSANNGGEPLPWSPSSASTGSAAGETPLFHDNRQKKHDYRMCGDEIRKRDQEIKRLNEELAVMRVDNAVLKGKAFYEIMERIFAAIGKPPNGGSEPPTNYEKQNRNPN